MPVPSRHSATTPSAAHLNRNAVQKIFATHQQQAKVCAAASPPPCYDSPKFRYDLPSASRAAAAGSVVSEPSAGGGAVSPAAAAAGPLHPLAKCGVEALTGQRLAGAVQPDWQTIDRRALYPPGSEFRGHLDIPSHLSQQFELSAEFKMNGVSHGSEAGPRHSTQQLLHYDACEKLGDPKHSNFAMTLAKSKHHMYIPSTKEPHGSSTSTLGLKSGPRRARSTVQLRKEKRELFHKQQSIARYEQTLPLRRAVDPYMQLTAAQADAKVNIPSEHTRQLLSDRYAGQHPLSNAYHQTLHGNEPLMRKVMRGDFYEHEAPAAAAAVNHTKISTPAWCGASPHNRTGDVMAAAFGVQRSYSSPSGKSRPPKNFIQVNREKVRGWSDCNTCERFAGRGVYVN